MAYRQKIMCKGKDDKRTEAEKQEIIEEKRRKEREEAEKDDYQPKDYDGKGKSCDD